MLLRKIWSNFDRRGHLLLLISLECLRQKIQIRLDTLLVYVNRVGSREATSFWLGSLVPSCVIRT